MSGHDQQHNRNLKKIHLLNTNSDVGNPHLEKNENNLD